MKKLTYTFTTTVQFSEEVDNHAFVLRCLPSSDGVQTVRANVDLEPDQPFDIQKDGFGNRFAVGMVMEPHDVFTFVASGTATVDLAARKPEPAHPLYLYDSEYTRMSDEMLTFLADSASEGMRQLVLGGGGSSSSSTFICEHLMHMVHQTLVYEPGSTTVETTAQQAFDQRKGVCQDYSHILIALIRACKIPARYVCGLTVGEGATHAWVEANIDGIWYGFDPTRDMLVDETYLKLAVGRDFSDCAIERGTFQGFVDQAQTVFARVEEVE